MVTYRLPAGAFVGEYELLRRLDGGGQGEVWEADAGSGVVALKISRPAPGNDRDARVRFERELRAAQTLQSTYVARPLDWDLSSSRAWIAYERVVGTPLQTVLRGVSVQLPLIDALDILADVAAGLAAIHEQGWTHCDVKPANIMVGPRSRAKILDLGAVAFGANSELTRFGIGTDLWRSPEQLHGGAITPASDVYALGLLVIKVVTGHRAFSDQYPFGTTPDLRGLPFGLADLTLDCLAIHPAHRPDTESAQQTLMHWRDELRRDLEIYAALRHGERRTFGDWPGHWSYLTQLNGLSYDTTGSGLIQRHASLAPTPVLGEIFDHADFRMRDEEHASGGTAQRGDWVRLRPAFPIASAQSDNPRHEADVAFFADVPRLPRGGTRLPDPVLCPRCGAATKVHNLGRLRCPAVQTCPPQLAHRIWRFISFLDPCSRGKVTVRDEERIEEEIAELVAQGLVTGVGDLIDARGLIVRGRAWTDVHERARRAVDAVREGGDIKLLRAVGYPWVDPAVPRRLLWRPWSNWHRPTPTTLPRKVPTDSSTWPWTGGAFEGGCSPKVPGEGRLCRQPSG